MNLHGLEMLIRQKLVEYQENLVPENAHLFTSKTGCTGFGTELIDAVLEHSDKIFELSYIKRHLPVFFARHANLILKVVFQDIDGLNTSLLETTNPSPYEASDMYYTGHYDGPEVD